GRHNPPSTKREGATPMSLAESLGRQNLPVYPVAVGDRRSPPDLAVTAVRAPDAVFQPPGDANAINLTVEAAVRASGLPAQEFTVELRRGEEVLERKTVRHNGQDQEYPLSFAVSLQALGTQKLTVAARPATGEAYEGNNHRSVAVKVVADQAEVLLVDGEA